MTDNLSFTNPVGQAPIEPKPKRRFGGKTTAAIGFGALLLGTVIGGSSADSKTPVSNLSPEFVTRTERVEVTPQACLDAIEAARTGFSLAGEGFMVASEYPDLAVEAFSVGASNGAGVDALLAKIKSVNERFTDNAAKLDPASFTTAAAACEAS